MSALPTYVSATVTPVSTVVTPATQASPGRVFRDSDRVPRAPDRRPDAVPKTEFRIASCRDELYAAFGLVYENYLRSGFTETNPYQMRVTPYHALPTTEVLVAEHRGEVIGTMSLILDGELGLPMEAVYGQEVDGRRRQGICLAEVGCLANQHQELDHSFPILCRLMSLTAQCAKQRGVDQILIAVHPRHVKFYERFMGFKPFGQEKTYGVVCDNPAVALAVDLNRLPTENPRVYKRHFEEPFPDEVLNCRPLSDELRSELEFMANETYYAESCYEPAAALASC